MCRIVQDGLYECIYFDARIYIIIIHDVAMYNPHIMHTHISTRVKKLKTIRSIYFTRCLYFCKHKSSHQLINLTLLLTDLKSQNNLSSKENGYSCIEKIWQ